MAADNLDKTVSDNLIPDGKIKQYLDANPEMVTTFVDKCKLKPNARHGTNVRYVKEINCYIKYGYIRVINSNILRDSIAKNNLDQLVVPKKYLYHVPNTPLELKDENYIVVVEGIERAKTEYGCYTLNYKQTEQLCTLVLENNYFLFTPNYFITTDGKVAIIDTDSEAMPTGDTLKEINDNWLAIGDRFDLPHQGYMFDMEHAYYNHPLASSVLILSKILIQMMQVSL